MKSQTEEMLWIAAQEDHMFPLEILNYAISKNISLSELLGHSVNSFEGVSAKSVKQFFENTNKINEKKYKSIWNSAKSQRASLITYDDPYFPTQLKELESNTTVLLYHKGIQIPFEKCVAIVGTRNCSTYAAEFTRELSMQVVQKGYTVVAGLALGIDTISHRGALKAGGKTIAVLAWMDNPNPTSNHKLLDEIIKNGFAISDSFFNYHGMMAKSKFVHRNEIISGISDYLVAVESGITGGTIHQVEIALRQNRIVIAVEPKSDNNEANRGFEKFEKLGAIPAKSVEDVLHIIEERKITKLQVKSNLLEFS